MARSRRRSMPRRRRPKADWVYRDNIYSTAGPDELLGSYTPRGTSILAGPAQAAGKILYDSKGYINPSRQGTTGVTHPVSAAARSEGSKARILMVEGVVFVTPSTWVLGSQMLAGFRFGVFEQSPVTGNIQVDANYSMWSEQLDVTANPAIWADRPHSLERRLFRRFAGGNELTAWTLAVRFRVNRTLMPNQCFGMYVENSDSSGGLGSSVTFIIQPWLRTLVVDEG